MNFSQAIDLKGKVYKLVSEPFHLNITNIIVFILLSFSATLHASSFEATQGFTSVNLSPIIEYIEDKDHSLNLARAKEASWQPIEGDGFSKGFSDAQYWFRFNLSNKADQEQHYILEITHPFLDTLDIIYEKNGQVILTDQLGDQLANSDRRLKHSYALSSFSLEVDEQVSVYVRIMSKSTLQLPITLWEKDAYTEHNHSNSVFFGILLGIIFAISIYHLLIYFTVFEPVYLYFGFFMAGATIILACLTGLPSFFIWPNQKAEVDNVLLVCLFMSATFSCFFARSVVDTPLRAPRINILLNLCAITSITGFLCIPILPYASLLKLVLFWAF